MATHKTWERHGACGIRPHWKRPCTNRDSLRFTEPRSSRCGRRSDLDLGHPHHIDDLQALIDPNDYCGPSPGRMSDEIGMRHVDSRLVSQAKCKRPKWCRVNHLSQILWPHVRNSLIDLATNALRIRLGPYPLLGVTWIIRLTSPPEPDLGRVRSQTGSKSEAITFPIALIRALIWADENLALQHFALPTSLFARIGAP